MLIGDLQSKQKREDNFKIRRHLSRKKKNHYETRTCSPKAETLVCRNPGAPEHTILI
jgi:hypothetical protein